MKGNFKTEGKSSPTLLYERRGQELRKRTLSGLPLWKRGIEGDFKKQKSRRVGHVSCL
jgi:hypothetical protein